MLLASTFILEAAGMRIDEATGIIYFDHLVSANRAFGDKTPMSVTLKAADPALAENAPGAFEEKTVTELYNQTKSGAKKLAASLAESECADDSEETVDTDVG